MPSISPIDIASFAIANAAAGPEVARAFLLQGSLGANGPLIAAKMITDQIAALQAEVAASAQNAASLSAQAHDRDEIATKLNEATTRLSQSESDLATLKQEHAALQAENVALGDAAAILARQYRMADVDDAQWAAKLKEVRAAIEKSDTDNDAIHMMLFFDHPDRVLNRFLLQAQLDDGSVHPVITRDLHSFADRFQPLLEKLEQRNAAAQQGEYVPAETFTVELALSALGQPAAGGDAPPAPPEAPTPPASGEPVAETQQPAAADDTTTALPGVEAGDSAPIEPDAELTIEVGSEPAPIADPGNGDTDPIVAPEPVADEPGEVARLREALSQSDNKIRDLTAQARDRDEIATKLNEAATRLSQSESELVTLKQDHAALKAENAAFGDATAIIAYFFRDSAMDDATWAARLEQLRKDIEARDDDNDFLHLLQFPHGMRPEMDNFFIRVLLDDKTLDPTLVKDFRAYVDTMRSVAEKIEKRGLAAQQGEYVPAQTFTVELALTALGQPAAGGDAPPSTPETPPPPAPTPTPRSPRKSGRSPKRDRK